MPTERNPEIVQSAAPEVTAVGSRGPGPREMTAFIALPFLIWIVGWTPGLIWASVVSAVAVLALLEFLILGEKKHYVFQKALCVLLLVFILVTFVTNEISVEVGVFAVLLLIPGSYVFADSDLEIALPASAVAVLSVLYIGMLAGALIRLRLDFEPFGSRLIFFLLITVWTSDAGAYYVGRKFGRRKLIPRVSPKKTVEGGMGGVATSMVSASIIHFTFFPEFPLIHAMAAALLLSFAGIVGDLTESAWKRSAAVKDSGGMLPGHGGFLDRIDSILFTAPVLYAYWFLLDERFALVTR